MIVAVHTRQLIADYRMGRVTKGFYHVCRRLTSRSMVVSVQATVVPPPIRADVSHPDLTTEQIVSELDRHVIGQHKAKRALAFALSDRLKRQRFPPQLKHKANCSNILLIGPSGTGKTETALRLSYIVGAPFVKIEATRYIEDDAHGTDTEVMIRALIDSAIVMRRDKLLKSIRGEVTNVVDKFIINSLFKTGIATDLQTVESKYKAGELENETIPVEIKTAEDGENMNLPFDSILNAVNTVVSAAITTQETKIPTTDETASAGANFNQQQTPRLRVADARIVLVAQETASRIEAKIILESAIHDVEQNGIVVIDEIDELSQTVDNDGALKAKRTSFQRKLVPIIEGTTIQTLYGPVRTDQMLFIGSGTFSNSKPSDLLPELLGILPVRVQLESLTETDFRRILTEIEFNLIAQLIALMKNAGVNLKFTKSGIEQLARACSELNKRVHDIGAYRIRMVVMSVLEYISAHKQKEHVVDAEYVKQVMKRELGEHGWSKFK